MLGIVVKSNAYGHGIQEIAALCEQSANVHWLFTTSLSEALLLRNNGIRKPILVMCLLDADPAQALTHGIDIMAYEKETIDMLSALGRKLKIPANIHIKIDTGMSRFGLYEQVALKIITYAREQPFINVRGIYTHFCESDQENQEFTLNQLQQFNKLLAKLETMKITIAIKHASNSAAAALLPDARFNVVRVGAGAYGMWPSQAMRTKTQAIMPEFDLKPVMQWKSKILHMREIPSQQFVGYARSYQTHQPTKLAIVPVGYFEGYDRRLSNKGTMVITDEHGNPHYAPVMGRICMNVTMIDVSAVPTSKPGDEVILIGYHDKIKPRDIADAIGSFNPREITTRINPSIPRIIVE